MRRRTARVVGTAALLVSLALPLSAAGGSFTYRGSIPPGGTGAVIVKTGSPVSFSVVLRVPAAGRTQLFLSGRKVSRGGPLLDTRKHRCPRSGRTRTCRGSYETLPAGSYTWRIKRVAGPRALVTMTIRW